MPAIDAAAVRALVADPDAVRVEFQPVVGFDSRRIVGVEALLRPTIDGVPVPPLPVIEAAQAAGLTRSLGRIVIDHACRALAGWRAAGFESLILMVNVDATELADPDLVADVRSTLERHAVPADRFLLELTETAFIEDSDVVRSNLAGLRGVGMGLALDDFGTGYASLSHLRSVPLTTVKLDRQFIAGADRPGVDHEIVRNVIRLAHALGLRVVAEGVEHESQRAALERLGCDSWQGFLASRSIGADAVLHALVEERGPRLPIVEPAPDDCIVCDARGDDAWSEEVDAFVLRRSGITAWENVGGRGRGRAWAGAMAVDEAETPLLHDVLAERRDTGVVVHSHHPGIVRLIGPYHGRSAVGVRVDTDTVVVLGGAQRSLTDRCGDERWIRRASSLASEIDATPASSRLAGELVVTAAVHTMLAALPGSFDEAMRWVVSSALGALGCEFGVLYLRDGRRLAFDDGMIHDVDRDALRDALDRIAVVASAPLVAQDAVEWPLPAPLPRGFAVHSWIAVPMPDEFAGLLVCAHTDRDPRGFTTWCVRTAEALTAAAVHVLTVGLEREGLRGDAEPEAAGAPVGPARR